MGVFDHLVGLALGPFRAVGSCGLCPGSCGLCTGSGA